MIDLLELTPLAADLGRPVAGHGEDGAVDEIALVVQPTSDKVVEDDIATEFIVDDERVGRVLRPQVDESRVSWDEEGVGEHPPVVVTGQIVVQLRLRLVDVVEDRVELGRLAGAQLSVGVRQELGRVPGRGDERGRLDVAVLGVELTDDRRVDEKQVADELDVAPGNGRVAVKHLDAAD